MNENACLEELEYLKSIDNSLLELAELKPLFIDQYADNWIRSRSGKHVEYQKKVTLSGSAENFDLMMERPIKLRRVSTWANDATAKSYSVQVFHGSVDVSSAITLWTFTTDTNQSNYVDDDVCFLQPPIVVRIAVSASTAAKTLVIKIEVDEL